MSMIQRSCFLHSRFLLIRFLVFRQESSKSRFSHKSSKTKRLKRMKISSSISWDPFLDANICSNGGLIILKLMLKLLMRRSPMHHYPMRSLNYTFWAGKLFLTIINQNWTLLKIINILYTKLFINFLKFLAAHPSYCVGHFQWDIMIFEG